MSPVRAAGSQNVGASVPWRVRSHTRMGSLSIKTYTTFRATTSTCSHTNIIAIIYIDRAFLYYIIILTTHTIQKKQQHYAIYNKKTVPLALTWLPVIKLGKGHHTASQFTNTVACVSRSKILIRIQNNIQWLKPTNPFSNILHTTEHNCKLSLWRHSKRHLSNSMLKTYMVTLL